MTLDEKFKEVKKQIGLFLLENGFKKVKSHFRREFKDSRCVLLLIKPNGYSNETVVCWQLVGGIFFNALDPIFRSRVVPDDQNTTLVDKRFNTTTARDVSFWEITNESVVADHVDAFKETNKQLFEQLEKSADVREHAAWSVNTYLKNPKGSALSGFLEALALAKMSGKEREYSALRKIIEDRDSDSWYVQSHLKLIEEIQTQI